MKTTLFFALLLGAFISRVAAQSNQPTYNLEGRVSLMSNYVEYGLSHSDHDPALQGSFLFNMGPQFRMGLWGGNVAYDGGSSHFLLKANADLRVDFSADTLMRFGYSYNRYFKSDARDGNTISIEFNSHGYGVHYDQHSNFLGTKTRAAAYAFSKTWTVFQSWNWKNKIGYMTLDSDDLNDYFFYETYLGKMAGSVEYEIGGSYNSSASQFHDAGKPALVLRATVLF